MTENNQIKENALELLRNAALAGPGYQGKRQSFTLRERGQMAKAIEKTGLVPPEYLNPQINWIDRKAKLFEAGEYPDKGVTVSRDQLRSLQESFDLPVPVLIEHSNSPLELGYLTRVESQGDELFGTIALSEEANALIEKSGARALSLGLSTDLSQIKEVSLVRKPRVKSARLFSDELFFSGELTPTDAPSDYWRAAYEELKHKALEAEVDTKIDRFIKEGRILPCQTEFARALLMQEGRIEFDGDTVPISQLMLAIIERQPPHTLFSEIALSKPGTQSPCNLAPEEAEFYRKHFPGISLEQIAERVQKKTL